MGIEPFLITSSVVAVLAQRLLRTICTDCRTPYEPNTAELKNLRLPRSQWDSISKFYRGKGCPACLQTGYRGRIGIFEMLTMNDDMRTMTLAREDATQIRQASIQHGMNTLWAEGTRLVLTGKSTTEEIIRVLQYEDRESVSI